MFGDMGPDIQSAVCSPPSPQEDDNDFFSGTFDAKKMLATPTKRKGTSLNNRSNKNIDENLKAPTSLDDTTHLDLTQGTLGQRVEQIKVSSLVATSKRELPLNSPGPCQLATNKK